MQRSSSKQRLHATIEIGRDINIAIWGAAVYCACVVRDSLVVGEAKPRLRVDERSIQRARYMILKPWRG
jgi:hypothetical protein